MHESCKLVAAVFGVRGAFLARVDKESIVMEHVIGTCELSFQDEMVRQKSLCEYVLYQPPSQALVVYNCLTDSRTREMPMVQQLRIRFLIGMNIYVRGLPIACLCAFEQGDEEEKSSCNDKSNQLRKSFDDATVLSKATEKMEDELETLLFGLKL